MRRPRHGITSRGITLIEMLFVMTIIGLLVLMAMPKLRHLKQSADLLSAGSHIARAIETTRQAAIMRSRPAYFRLDNEAIWAVVDTSGKGDTLMLLPKLYLDSAYDVHVTSPTVATSIKYDARGVAIQTERTVFRFQHSGGIEDSVCVTKLGTTVRRVCP